MRAVLTHMQANPDTPVTIEQLADDLDYSEAQVSGAIHQLFNQLPERFTRPHRGVYIYHETLDEDSATMTVTVVHEMGRKLLVKDDEDRLWVLTRVEV